MGRGEVLALQRATAVKGWTQTKSTFCRPAEDSGWRENQDGRVEDVADGDGVELGVCPREQGRPRSSRVGSERRQEGEGSEQGQDLRFGDETEEGLYNR